MTPREVNLLKKWYLKNKRDLPWRKNRDPYRIWISEAMLQQTTTRAVLGFYDRFLSRFPDLRSLAFSSIEEVYAQWTGLGYYSRARNLHKAAIQLNNMTSFPKQQKELEKLPGFGPYTSRAVSSLAFSESVGVLDGNVIRVICRKEDLDWEWWRPRVRNQLQSMADQWAQIKESQIWNQALMELGSQICTPQNPKCIICPWITDCKAKKNKTTSLRPAKKPRRAAEYWVWQPAVEQSRDSYRLTTNDYAPFLKGSWIFPGSAKKLSKPPSQFHFRHQITHHDIYVQIQVKRGATPNSRKNKSDLWITKEQLPSRAPSSLIKKVIEFKNCPTT